MQALYKFHFDVGRMGELFGLFVAEDTRVEKENWDTTVCMYDVLGKHSEIDFVLKDAVQFVTANDEVIEMLESYGLVPFGYNPLDYLDDEGC
jgi:hypothetical protein